MAIHQSAEDYLESILILQKRRGQVRSIDIVNELGYSKPSISIAMKKLRESGHVCMAEDGTLTLTESGMAIASQVYSRHTAISQLFQLLGVSAETAAEATEESIDTTETTAITESDDTAETESEPEQVIDEDQNALAMEEFGKVIRHFAKEDLHLICHELISVISA